MEKRPEIVVTNGPLAGKRLEIPPAGLRMGRSSSNDLHVPDEELSRNHCIFERAGEAGIRVIDLASANGTFVNGERVGAEPRLIGPGDVVEAGATSIKVVGPETAKPAGGADAVDLGLGGAGAEAAGQGGEASGGGEGAAKRTSATKILWAVAVALAVAAIGMVLLAPVDDGDEPGVPAPAAGRAEDDRELVRLSYEKVEADAGRIFRYSMTLDEAGTLRVVYDDVPAADRHVDKSARLDAKALARIREIVDSKGWEGLDEAYSGPSASNENALNSWRIKVVRSDGAKEVSVENTLEPDAFRRVREDLEAFSRNELGIWAIQYSKEQLLEMSAASEKIGDAKWEERDVEYGNLSACVKAYWEASFYLETVDPKPEGYKSLRERLRAAEAELARRYEEQRFRADRAIKLGDWEAAKSELRVLCELVPDKDDDRHVEANAKLVDVERRMKRQKEGGKKGKGGR